jgi:hypothetical protein
MVQPRPRPLTPAPAAEGRRAERIRRRNRDLGRLRRLTRNSLVASVLAAGGLFALVAAELPGRPPSSVTSSRSIGQAPTSSPLPFGSGTAGSDAGSSGSGSLGGSGSFQPGALAPTTQPAPVATGAS